MGDIADSLINGEFDAISGEYIGRPVGYPRTYKNGKLVGLHEDVDRSSKNNMNGIHKYLNSKGIKNRGEHTKIVDAYLTSRSESNMILKGTFRQKSKFIQNNFGAFVVWFNKQIIKS